jgi:4-diphosphocytidyl-2-C-methyl-D-erythritol kinase
MMGAMAEPDRSEGVVLPVRERLTVLDDGSLRLAAPAKLNLNLRVGPRGPDGFHPLDSIVVKVSLYDEIVLRPRTDGQLALSCEGADCGPAEQNLALRAARLLAAAAGRDVGGAESRLRKQIPPGRGLGGGSSDAAAVLDGLSRLWRLGLSSARLGELAARLGSDVPLFLGPPAARMTGRGEVLASARVPAFAAVVHMPEVVCSTAGVYAAYDERPNAGMGEQIDLGLVAGEPASRWRHLLVNDLAAAALTHSPALARVRDELADALAVPVSVTGSGSGLFALFDGVSEASAALRRVPAGLRGRTVAVRPNPW